MLSFFLKNGDISLGKSRRKGFHGQKKGSSEKPSRRDYKLLSITISAPSLPPYDKFTPPILKRKAPRFRILKKCMTRLEALKLIRNGPTHPAMMRMTEESEHKMEFPSWMRLTSGKNLFPPFLSLLVFNLLLSQPNNKKEGFPPVDWQDWLLRAFPSANFTHLKERGIPYKIKKRHS